ncbi:hypothetical protein BDN72DRAFT_906560 [Pluteus cervinus]|uniref:Uncharacterized protein n=1 Tax=Pluteus cervinus TaxID=181527 RepID=A0ACD2ZYX9_9AGAR|nr:hypothetical protein BDN72DRAFT_906560 [Pluteus cervinus]
MAILDNDQFTDVIDDVRLDSPGPSTTQPESFGDAEHNQYNREIITSPDSLIVTSWNCAGSYSDVTAFLEVRRGKSDVIFVQEIPYKHIRNVQSTTNASGDAAWYPPKAAGWEYLDQYADGPKCADKKLLPTVMCYVASSLLASNPKLMTHVVNHRDAALISLTIGKRPYYLLGVYQKPGRAEYERAIRYLTTRHNLPKLDALVGDFNLHQENLQSS